ncbi:hypothetical protein SAMN02745857_01984 [Andreprevotia lacus DSM 23236]|jgi:hypothetical protein|uniref:DUF2214 domain-containing protein n=1 Tax=Andreprevotia lacus DSM 23236 TaxID=1121001 RepID=A0A1W1XLM0_9NEIS|nr:DUF2214 family protein [Andreprevotia lacus]SMC24843.1 hypothetical protein SAMN02745857_01984 [Andreprevotia lacus DSM 23236]
MLKMIMVYIHLLTTCIALATVLKADRRLWAWRKKPLDSTRLGYLQSTQRTASTTLAILWFSGLMLITLGYLQDGAQYLANPKLWAKVTVVILLTINGGLLHSIAFPALQKRIAFIALPVSERAKLALLGAISGCSWLFAAFLGIARPWNKVMPYGEVMLVFCCIAAAAILTGITLAIGLGRNEPANWLSTSAHGA